MKTAIFQKVKLISTALGAGQFAKANFGIAVNIANDNTNATMADSKLYISGTNGFVGIGNTSPTEPLSLSTSSAGEVLAATFYNTNATGAALGTGIHIGSGTSIGNAGIIKHYSNATLANARTTIGIWGDDLNNGVGLNIKGGGNVGIGTTTPNAKLQVNGAIITKTVSNITSNFTITDEEYIEITSASNITLTLPPAVQGRKIVIINVGLVVITTNANFVTLSNSTATTFSFRATTLLYIGSGWQQIA